MSRRKHQSRTATPDAPTPAVAPANRAAVPASEPARADSYHGSLPLRHRHAGGVDLGLRTHWAAAPPLPDGTPQVAEFDTYTDSLEALRLEQLVQGDPVDAGRSQGDRVDPVLAQEGGDGVQAVRVGRELSDRAGGGVGGEADAHPVGAGADVDAGGVRVLHGQGLDRGGPARAGGLARGLSPGLATLVSRAAGLSVRDAGRGGGLAPGRGCSHGRTPREERRWACREAVCGGAGSDGSQVMVASGNHAIPAGGGTGSGSPVMGRRRSPAQSHLRGGLGGVRATIEAPSRDAHRHRSG